MRRAGHRPPGLRARGATLVELLIAGAVGLIVMAAVFSVFSPARVFFQQANEISEMYADALVAMDKLSVEIEEANAWLVNATDGNPPALALPSARNAQNEFQRDSDGTPRWQKWILYYVATVGSDLVLVRKTTTGTFPPSPLPYTIPPANLGPPAASDKILVRNLSLFRVTTTSANDGAIRCQVELTISRPSTRPGGQRVTHTQRFERTVTTRNQT